MSTFLYKYAISQSLTKGKKTPLYFSRFIFQLYRSLPVVLRLAIISFRFFNLFYKSCNSLIHFRFWLLTIHHFLQIYQVIFLLRILTEYYFINQHSSNKLIKIIFYLSEPYFKIVQLFTPKGFIGNIIAFQAIEVVNFFIKRLCRICNTYSTGSIDLNEVNILLRAVADEKVIFA